MARRYRRAKLAPGELEKVAVSGTPKRCDILNTALDYSGPTGKPLICLNDVTLRVRDKLLLSHTCWEIRTDEQWAVFGTNGSG